MIQLFKLKPGIPVKQKPEGDFPNDLSLLPPDQVHQWQIYWFDQMGQTIEPDKRHIYEHNWKRCCKYLERKADQTLEAQMNMEKRS